MRPKVSYNFHLQWG